MRAVMKMLYNVGTLDFSTQESSSDDGGDGADFGYTEHPNIATQTK